MTDLKVSFEIDYTDAEGVSRSVHIDELGDARPMENAYALGVVVRRRQDASASAGAVATCRRLCVMPSRPVTLTSVRARIVGFDLRTADALFLNGYNSWTDSVERAPIAAMRGLVGVPRKVIDTWVLDNSGDYRFTAQDIRPGHQHGFGYGYVRHDDKVCLVGSLNEDSGFTTIYEDLRSDALTLDKEVPQAELMTDREQEVMSFVLCEGTLTEALDSWLVAASIKPRPAAPLVGYSSWYRHYGDISQAKLEHDLEGVREMFGGRDLGKCIPVFQVDDGYTKVGDWLKPDETRFPDGMAHLAQAAQEKGLLPGIWLAPFLVETESVLYREHPEWLLHDDAGNLVAAGGNWSGAWALDLAVPDARKYVSDCLSTVTRTWGFKLLKLDFLYAACLLPGDGKNRGQRMADALDLLRASVPDDVVFDLCGVPMMSAFGRTEYCRIGCDVSLDWNDVPYMRVLHRERVSTKRSLANTYGRAHLDGRVFRNDPDVFFLRDDVKLTAGQRLELLQADATLGGMFLTSDDPALWDEAQRIEFEHALTQFIERS